MPPELHFDLAQIDFSNIVADQEAIRAVNPQRFEMLQLDAVIYLDAANHITIGYKDVRYDEFWVRGHMPGFPLMPGVIMCEAGAQLIGLYAKKNLLVAGSFIVFSGMDAVRFRGQVKPGDRFWLVGKASKVTRRQVTFEVQGFASGKMVFEGTLNGMPFTPQDGTSAPEGAS